jgi:hypothetical protein
MPKASDFSSIFGCICAYAGETPALPGRKFHFRAILPSDSPFRNSRSRARAHPMMHENLRLCVFGSASESVSVSQSLSLSAFSQYETADTDTDTERLG